MQAQRLLTTVDHSREAAGLKYVYPVVSRRAGGVSIGVNLNPNNACNWACIYCQVPNLRRGTAPVVDLARLEQELESFVQYVLHGDFMQRWVPQGARRLNDIAISGNGEPTTAKEFDQVVALVGRIIEKFDLLGKIKLVLITNGSLVKREAVQRGLRQMKALNGEVWFKLDRATSRGMLAINHVRLPVEAVRENLRISAELCPTWLQTCVFAFDDEPPSAEEQQAYLDFVARSRDEGVAVQGVLLYGLARPSMQPQASHLSPLPAAWLREFARRIEALGIAVKVTE